jgi:hypothetical protein
LQLGDDEVPLPGRATSPRDQDEVAAGHDQTGCVSTWAST